jgi:hypothetical protein
MTTPYTIGPIVCVAIYGGGTDKTLGIAPIELKYLTIAGTSNGYTT